MNEHDEGEKSRKAFEEAIEIYTRMVARTCLERASSTQACIPKSKE